MTTSHDTVLKTHQQRRAPTSGDRGRKYGPIATLTLAYIKGSRYRNRSANHWTYENCPVRTSER